MLNNATELILEFGLGTFGWLNLYVTGLSIKALYMFEVESKKVKFFTLDSHINDASFFRM